MDHTWADTAGGPQETDNPNLGQGSTGKDILDHMEKLTKGNCCIRRYTIAGHGRGAAPVPPEGQVPGKSSIPSSDFPAENGFYAPGDEYWNSKNKGPNARATDDLEKAIAAEKIRFCEPCVIQVHGCNLGRIVQSLSRVTHCRVVAAGGFCSFRDRSWVSDDHISENGTKGAGDNFWESVNGSEPKPIGRVYRPGLNGPIPKPKPKSSPPKPTKSKRR